MLEPGWRPRFYCSTASSTFSSFGDEAYCLPRRPFRCMSFTTYTAGSLLLSAAPSTWPEENPKPAKPARPEQFPSLVKTRHDTSEDWTHRLRQHFPARTSA